MRRPDCRVINRPKSAGRWRRFAVLQTPSVNPYSQHPRGNLMEKELAPKGSVSAKGKPVSKKAKTGLVLKRRFTTPGVDPADEMAWEHRAASITGEDGKLVF